VHSADLQKEKTAEEEEERGCLAVFHASRVFIPVIIR
jgi:hypothetical protein